MRGLSAGVAILYDWTYILRLRLQVMLDVQFQTILEELNIYYVYIYPATYYLTDEAIYILVT